MDDVTRIAVEAWAREHVGRYAHTPHDFGRAVARVARATSRGIWSRFVTWLRGAA